MRFAVIGSPIAHSRSPAMHSAAYRALDLPHTYEKLETSHDALGHRIADLRHHDLDGINVTVPHKTAVLELVDEVAPAAAAIGAANTLVRGSNGRIVAHNTDAPALMRELARLYESADPNPNEPPAENDGGATAPGRDNALGRGIANPTANDDASGGGVALTLDHSLTGPAAATTEARPIFAGRSALVLGSGGAARAAVFALRALGAQVIVRSRRPLDDLPHEPLSAPARESSSLAAIIQCTTAGMHGGPPGAIAAAAVDWDSVPADCVAYDVVYSSGETSGASPQTPFLAAARERGLRCADGRGMLVEQGAIAFELWLGISPPRDVMRAAVL